MKRQAWAYGVAMLACSGLAACSGGYSAFAPAQQAYSANTGAPTTTKTQTSGAPSAPTPSPSPTPSSAGAGLTWIGRTTADATDANLTTFSFAGVRLGVHFSGTELNISLNDLPATFLGHTGNAYFDVVIDGQAGTAFSITPDQSTYKVAAGLAAGEHTVWISKRTEGMIGSVQFHGIDLAGGTLLSPPARPLHRIEVMGASADNGYGVEDVNCGGYVDAQQNEDLSWPQLAADGLNAEVANLAYSGKGLVVNYDPVDDPTLTFPVIYAYADTNLASAWDFAAWTPDAVLIDLGGNDLTGNGGTLPADFESSFVTFLQTVYGHYPQTMVYLVNNATETGSGRTQLATALQDVVTQMQQAGQSKIAYFEFTEYTGTVFGCDGHPSAALHQQIAAEVISRLQTDLGL